MEAQVQERGTAPERSEPLRVVGVPLVAAEQVWLLAEGFLAPLLEKYPLENIDDVRDSVLMGHRDLWFLMRGDQATGAATTQVVVFPQHRVLELAFLAGVDVTRDVGILAQWLDEVARKKGCTMIQVFGRKGWGKLFKRFNATEISTLYTVELA